MTPASAAEHNVAAETPVTVMKAVPTDPLLVFEAILANDEARLGELLQAGLPAEQMNGEGDSPLCLSLRLRFLPLAVKLIEHGANPNTPGLGKQVPVVLASMYRHPTLLEDLLKAGADPNVPFSHQVAPELLELVPDPWLRGELKRERNVTALMACSLRGDVEGVISLVKFGASKNAHTLPSYRYPINMAAGRGYLFIMRVLLGRDPDEEPARLITVDLSEQKFWVVQHGEEILRSSISSGRNGKETPPGRYVITNKHKDWVSTIYKVPMPYFLRFNCSEIGFHSGRVTGRPASAGCVRLPHAMAKKMFDLAQVGDEVIIEP
ncbi:L,D-transpeptidase family protein [Phragmitibacter flavus]|uniref:L,D-transpeptidase family protein n=1 Tax=Phragmitibacter flavus TaxID=2576071 RepID=UPI00140B5C8C|nr:L,D-transpeptidase family protein [Phragmitibacter flavus]